MSLVHFLVEKRGDHLERIDVFYDGDAALEAFSEREQELGYFNRTRQCVLLGSDSLRSAMATHGNWFVTGEKGLPF